MLLNMLPLDQKIFSNDLNNISQIDMLKLYLQKALYAQLSVFAVCFLISVTCLVISPWSLCLLKPTWCLSIFKLCCKNKPIPTLLCRSLAIRPQQSQAQHVEQGEQEMSLFQPSAPQQDEQETTRPQPNEETPFSQQVWNKVPLQQQENS